MSKCHFLCAESQFFRRMRRNKRSRAETSKLKTNGHSSLCERINQVRSHSLKLAWRDDSLSDFRCYAPCDHYLFCFPPPCKSAACAIKEKLTGAYRKVSFASSEKMENSVEQSQGGSVIKPWQELAALSRRLME